MKSRQFKRASARVKKRDYRERRRATRYNGMFRQARASKAWRVIRREATTMALNDCSIRDKETRKRIQLLAQALQKDVEVGDNKGAKIKAEKIKEIIPHQFEQFKMAMARYNYQLLIKTFA